MFCYLLKFVTIAGRAQLFYYQINEIINLSYLLVLQVCVLYFPKKKTNPEYLPQYEYPNKFNNYFNEFRKRKLYLCSLRLFVKTGGWGGGLYSFKHKIYANFGD